jgi:hypothetical protein
MEPLTWRQVARHDYYSGLGAMFVAFYPLSLVVLPVVGFLNTEGDMTLCGLAFVAGFYTMVTLACLTLTWLRIRKLLGVCKLGRLIDGKVVANFYADYRDKPPGSFPGGGMLSFEYECENKLQQSWIALWRTRACERISAGDIIRLSVHSRYPLVAVPNDLFREPK